jgi:hypothetical protein
MIPSREGLAVAAEWGFGVLYYRCGINNNNSTVPHFECPIFFAEAKARHFFSYVFRGTYVCINVWHVGIACGGGVL